MAPEVIACDENPDATYDYRVRAYGDSAKNTSKKKNTGNTKERKWIWYKEKLTLKQLKAVLISCSTEWSTISTREAWMM